MSTGMHSWPGQLGNDDTVVTRVPGWFEHVDDDATIEMPQWDATWRVPPVIVEPQAPLEERRRPELENPLPLSARPIAVYPTSRHTHPFVRPALVTSAVVVLGAFLLLGLRVRTEAKSEPSRSVASALPSASITVSRIDDFEATPEPKQKPGPALPVVGVRDDIPETPLPKHPDVASMLDAFQDDAEKCALNSGELEHTWLSFEVKPNGRIRDLDFQSGDDRYRQCVEEALSVQTFPQSELGRPLRLRLPLSR